MGRAGRLWREPGGALKFRDRPVTDEVEINLIPFIDVLLVIMIFLVMTTSYSRFTEIQVNLPNADAEVMKERPREVVVGVTADGRYLLDRKPLADRSVQALSLAMSAAAAGTAEVTIVVSADAAAAHQSVINVLDAARRAGLTRLTFAAQGPARPR